MSPIAVIAPAPKARATGPVAMWPYVAACFAWNTCVIGAAVFASLHWGFTSPGFVGFLSACISIVGAAWFFFRNHRRRFLPLERWRFILGSFLAFWFYDEFLRVALMVTHGGGDAKAIATAIVATLVDFGLVWIIVGATDLWAARSYGSAQDRGAA